MTKLNVLMLGWHASPLLSGGLGVASLGIAKALSDRVNLSLILPETPPEFAMENVEVTDLSGIDVEAIQPKVTVPDYEVFAPVDYIPSDLTPYMYDHTVSAPSEKSTVAQTGTYSQKQNGSPTQKQPANPGLAAKAAPAVAPKSVFASGEPYSNSVNFKVIQYARFASRLASNKEFDVIYAHDWMTFQAGIEIKLLTKKPLVLHVHSLSYDRDGADTNGWVFEMEKNAFTKADQVIAVSDYTASVLQEHYGVSEDKITTVYHGLEPVSPFRTQNDSSAKLVVFLGRLAKQKGPATFVEVAQKVKAQNPQARFVMAGNGPLAEELKNSEAVQSLGDAIEFPGFLDRLEVYDLLSRADVFCMPSVSEPFGLAALEAAQFGVPVVVSKEAGVAEVLRHALTADPTDATQMAQHVLDLLEDSPFRKRVITETFRDLENLTWENTAEEIVQLLEQIA